MWYYGIYYIGVAEMQQWAGRKTRVHQTAGKTPAILFLEVLAINNPIDFVKDYDKISLTILLIIIGGNRDNKKDKKSEIKLSSENPMIRQLFQDYDINNIYDLENALKDVLESNIEEMKALGMGDMLLPERQNKMKHILVGTCLSYEFKRHGLEGA